MFFNKRCMPKQNMCCAPQMPTNCQQEVIEPTITKCIEKEFHHEVPHICPIHTHVINKHVYTHKYMPQYTCSEENVIINNDCGKCNQF